MIVVSVINCNYIPVVSILFCRLQQHVLITGYPGKGVRNIMYLHMYTHDVLNLVGINIYEGNATTCTATKRQPVPQCTLR